MKAYYSENGIEIYHADCRDILPSLPKVDLVLTDPPYGVGKAEWDTEFLTDWMSEAAILTSVLGLMPGVWNILHCPAQIRQLSYVWTLSAHIGNGRTRGAIGSANWIPCLAYVDRNAAREDAANWCQKFADWCEAQGIRRGDLDKVAGTSDMGGWWVSRLSHRCDIPAPHQWEKLRDKFNPPEDLDTLVYAVTRGNIHNAMGDCRTFHIRGAMPDHPSPKPLAVVIWFLERLGGNLILDPFMGSGTTLVAAKALGRKAIGIEIEEKYCEIAVNRLRQQVLDFQEKPEEIKKSFSPLFEK